MKLICYIWMKTKLNRLNVLKKTYTKCIVVSAKILHVFDVLSYVSHGPSPNPFLYRFLSQSTLKN